MKLVTNKFKSGRLNEKHVVATWILGTISAYAYRHRETEKNLCRRDRSHDLANTDFQAAVRHPHRRYWHFYPKQGGSNFLRNVSELLPYYKTVYRLWLHVPYGTSVRDTAMPSCKYRACVHAVIGTCGFPLCPEKEGAVKLKKTLSSWSEVVSRGEGVKTSFFFLGLLEIATNVFWMAGVWAGNGGVSSDREGNIRLL